MHSVFGQLCLPEGAEDESFQQEVSHIFGPFGRLIVFKGKPAAFGPVDGARPLCTADQPPAAWEGLATHAAS